MSISDYEFEAYLEGLLFEDDEPETYDPEWNARVMEHPPQQAVKAKQNSASGLVEKIPF